MPIGYGLAGGRLGLGLAQGGGTVALPWYRAGGAAAPLVAYQPKGAASYAASKINLANPGTYNATDGTAYPTWAGATGWTFNGTDQRIVVPVKLNRPFTLLIAASQSASDAGGLIWTGGAEGGQGLGLGLGSNFNTTNDLVVALASSVAWLTSATAATRSGFVLGATAAAAASGVSAAYVLYLDGASVKSGNTGIYDTLQDLIVGQAQLSRDAAFSARAVALYNSVLTGSQVAAVSAAMAAL